MRLIRRIARKFFPALMKERSSQSANEPGQLGVLPQRKWKRKVPFLLRPWGKKLLRGAPWQFDKWNKNCCRAFFVFLGTFAFAEMAPKESGLSRVHIFAQPWMGIIWVIEFWRSPHYAEACKDFLGTIVAGHVLMLPIPWIYELINKLRENALIDMRLELGLADPSFESVDLPGK